MKLAKNKNSPRRAPQPGDILLFTRPRRTRDYIIRWVTHSRFYHVALYAGGHAIIEARPRGVARHDLHGRDTDIYVIPAPEGKGTEALAWAERQIGAQFDPTGLLVILCEHLLPHLRIQYAPCRKYTCSDLIAQSFRAVGVDLLPGHALNEIVPGDFAALLPPDAQPHTIR